MSTWVDRGRPRRGPPPGRGRVRARGTGPHPRGGGARRPALREAILLEHNYIGTEHMLLGLLHTETGAAHDILAARGVRLEPARGIVEELVRGRRAG